MPQKIVDVAGAGAVRHRFRRRKPARRGWVEPRSVAVPSVGRGGGGVGAARAVAAELAVAVQAAGVVRGVEVAVGVRRDADLAWLRLVLAPGGGGGRQRR